MQQTPYQWLRILESCCARQKTTYASHCWLIKWTNTLLIHKFNFIFYVFALLVSLAPYKFEISLSATHIRDFVRDYKMNMNYFRLLQLFISLLNASCFCDATRDKTKLLEPHCRKETCRITTVSTAAVLYSWCQWKFLSEWAEI